MQKQPATKEEYTKMQKEPTTKEEYTKYETIEEYTKE